jgi:hypothetical protein
MLSQQRQELYSAIGEAITSWIAVEDQLANLFAYFVAGDGMSLSAKAAFHAVLNFNSRLAMTDAAARWRSGIDHERWRTLFNRLNRKSKQRNELAHFTIIRYTSFPGRSEPRLYLASSLENVDAHLETGLTLRDVRQRAAAFRKLAQELSQFSVQAGAVRPTLLSEPLAQLLGLDADGASESPEIQTHTEQQPPPGSSRE